MNMPDIIDSVKVGETIKRLLKQHNMTQDNLADALSISKSAVSQNLRGKSTFDIQNLIQIAKLFDITLDELLNLKSSEGDNVITEYKKIVQKGVTAIQQVPTEDLRVYEPDLYGKVLVDYVIEARNLEMFKYLHEHQVKLVEDYYHRAKDIYLGIIRYMLEEDQMEIILYIMKYTALNGSFAIDNVNQKLIIWGLLDKPNYQPIIKELMTLRSNIRSKWSFSLQTKDPIPLTKVDFLEVIASFHLKNILNTYLSIKDKDEDLLFIVDKFIEHGFIDGISTYIDFYYKTSISWVRKVSLDVQKAFMSVLKTNDYEIVQKFAEKGLYADLTPIVKQSITNAQHEITSHLIATYHEELNFKKIGESCVLTSNLTLLKDILKFLSEDDLNYLLSFVKLNDLDTLIFLIECGARIDEKYYNLETFKKINHLIDHLMKKGDAS